MNRSSRAAVADHGSMTSRAVANRVQAKLSVGRARDGYEQEADRVADAVVKGTPAATAPVASGGMASAVGRGSALAPPISRLVDFKPQRRLQRQDEKEEPQGKVQRAGEEKPQGKIQRAEEEEPQGKIQRAEEEEPQGKIQRAEEEEPQGKIQRAEEEEPQGKIQRAEEEEPQGKIQRAEEEEPQGKIQREEQEEPQSKIQREKEKKEEEEVQAKTEARANVRDKRHYLVLNRVERKLFDNKGKGEPLADETRIAMEVRFGADFSAVKIHTDADAVAMSRELSALAFTHGRDIFFNAGKYEPESVRGRTLLAHELTHVVQQGAAEQKVSEETITKNNAERDRPPLEPTDVKAIEAEKTTEENVERNAPKPREQVTAKAGSPFIAKGSVTAPAAKPDLTAPEAEAKPTAEEGEVGEAVKTKRPPAKKAVAEKVAGTGVGGFLRKVTQSVFKAKQAAVSKLATNEKTKESAEKKLEQTEKAVVPPSEEGQSQARAVQVETVEAAKKPEPDEGKAKQQFEQAMERAVPKNLEEVDKFKEEGKGRVVGQAVKGVVMADSQEVKGTYQEIDNPPKIQPPETVPETLPETEGAPETPTIDMGEGLVGEVQPEHTNLSGFDRQSDDLLEKEQIKEEHLEMVDEGDLAEAKQARKEAKTKIKEGPRQVEIVEQQEKQKVSKDLQKEELAGKQQMKAARQEGLGGARADQQKTKSKIEQKRQAVTDHINAIYQNANDLVKQKLDDLEKKSLKAFDEGQQKATKTFEDNVKRRIDAFKRRRYDRFGGSLLWAKDKLFGMDDLPEVKEIFDSEKARFITTIDGLVKTITAENKRVIEECKSIVTDARKEIEAFVKNLGPELQKTGQDALKDMKGKLDALDKQINDKEKELKKKLAAKREAAIKAIEKKIEKMKEEMSGLVSKLGKLLLNAMLKFFKWALKKAGYSGDQLMGIINKGKAIVTKIVTDPKAFFKNLGRAVGLGIKNFRKNIKQHLIGGLVSWLTGAMADVPIQLPAKWDLKGVLSVILQVLGLTWDRIRRKLVKRLGEKVIRIAETSIDILKRLITEGPIALWEMIKTKAAEIKQKVMEGIRNWIIVQIVKAAIIKLVSMLNPVGAIIQAILAIYNLVMFFIENWQRIVEFVKSIFQSIGDIAFGKISAAAQKVEQAMAMTIPIILNFLARLLHISGISKAITNIMKKIRKPIDKVVNKVIASVAKMAKKLVKKAKQAAEKVIDWWKAKFAFKTKDGKRLIVAFKGKKKAAKLTVTASPAVDVDKELDDVKAAHAKYKADAKASSGPLLARLKQLMTKHAAAKSAHAALKRRIAKGENIDGTKVKELGGMVRDLRNLILEIQRNDAVEGAKTKFSTSTGKEGFGVHTLAFPLTLKGPPGSSPSDTGSTWDDLTKRRTESGKTSYYIRGHLLNDKLHGPGKWKNMTPLTRQANKDHEASIESRLKSEAVKLEPAQALLYRIKIVEGPPDGYDGSAMKNKVDKIQGKKGWSTQIVENMKEIIEAEKFVPKKLLVDAKRVTKPDNVNWPEADPALGGDPTAKYVPQTAIFSGKPIENKPDLHVEKYNPGTPVRMLVSLNLSQPGPDPIAAYRAIKGVSSTAAEGLKAAKKPFNAWVEVEKRAAGVGPTTLNILKASEKTRLRTGDTKWTASG
jgi:hypothetical protein